MVLHGGPNDISRFAQSAPRRPISLAISLAHPPDRIQATQPNSELMRYSIMLQLVVATTLILTGAAAFFAWLQNRPAEIETSQTACQAIAARAAEPGAHG